MQLYHRLREIKTLVLPLPQLMVRPSRLIGHKLTRCTVAMDLTGDPLNHFRILENYRLNDLHLMTYLMRYGIIDSC